MNQNDWARLAAVLGTVLASACSPGQSGVSASIAAADASLVEADGTPDASDTSATDAFDADASDVTVHEVRLGLIPCTWDGKTIDLPNPAPTSPFPRTGEACAKDALAPGKVCRAGNCETSCIDTCTCESGRWSCAVWCNDYYVPGVSNCGTPPLCDRGCPHNFDDAGKSGALDRGQRAFSRHGQFAFAWPHVIAG
ncbi:MAG: hypothetical protein NVS3B20_01880 [Polyangiales bacterium]